MGQNENYTALFAFIELNFGGAGVKNNEKSENSKKNCLKKILYWMGGDTFDLPAYVPKKT